MGIRRPLFLIEKSGKKYVIMEEAKPDEISRKILEGIKIALKKLVEKKKNENSYMVFSDGKGKIVKIPAAEIDGKFKTAK